MLLTIVTIIFLPLSFMSSVFGMNAVEFDSGGSPQPWSSSAVGNNVTMPSSSSGQGMGLVAMFTYLFPLSLLVILLSTTLAFSTWIRSGLYAACIILRAAVFEYSGLRQVCLLVMEKLHKTLKLSRNRRKGDGFYLIGAKVRRRIYGRKNRKILTEALAAVEQKKRKRYGTVNIVGPKKRAGIFRWIKWFGKNDIEGKARSSHGSTTEEFFSDKV